MEKVVLCPFCGNILETHLVDKQDDPDYVGGYFVDCRKCSCHLGPFNSQIEAECVANKRF